MKEKWYKQKLDVVMENNKCKYYGTWQYKRTMKYMGENQISLWYKRIKIFAR